MRAPIEAPARGGATPGSIQNRAAYMRPPLESQNSRMLARAFAQMNASFGRIAANESRLTARSQAEELALAEEEQAEAEARAKELGKIAGLTGQDLSEAMVMNPNSQAVYQEYQVVGQASKAAADFATQVQLSGMWGDPDQASDFQSAWTDAATQSILNAPAAAQQEVAAIWSQSFQANSAGNVEASANEMIRRETKAVSEITYSLAMQADPNNPQAFMDALLAERDKLRDARGVRGNDMFTNGLVSMMGVIQATEDVSITAPLAKLMTGLIDNVDDPAFSKSFIREFNNEDKARLIEAANGLQGHVMSVLEEKQQQERQRQDEEFSDLVAQALGNPAAFRASLGELVNIYGGDTSTAMKQYRHVEALLEALKNEARETDEIASQLALAQLLEQKNNGDYENLAAFYTGAFSQLTAGDFQTLLKTKVNTPSPLELSGEYKNFKSNLGGLTALLDNIAGDTFKPLFSNDGSGPQSNITKLIKLRLEAYEEQYRDQWEQALRDGPEAQKKFLDNAKLYALEFALRTPTGDGQTLKDKVIEYYSKNRDELEKDLAAKLYFKDYISFMDSQDQTFISDMEEDFGPALRGENEDDGIEVPSQVSTIEFPPSFDENNPAAAMVDFEQRLQEAEAVREERRRTSVSEQQATVTLDMLDAPSELATLDLPAALATLDVPAASSPTEVPTSSGYQPAMRPNVSREEQQIPEVLGSDSVAYRPPIVLPGSRDTLDVPETSSPTAIPTSSGAQRATAPDVTREEQQIPQMAQVASRASINAAGTRSTISVPTVDPAQIPETSGYTAAPRGSALSVAASIPELQQVTSVAQQMISNTSAANPEEILKTTTAFDFAKEYLGKTESDDHKVLTSFIKQVNPQFDNVKDMAWCAGFVNAVLNGVDRKGTGKLNARSFLNWGKSVSEPQEGDVVVFWRESKSSWKGHVGFFAGFDDDGDILVLGGNQNNSVSIKSYDKDRLLGYRRSE